MTRRSIKKDETETWYAFYSEREKREYYFEPKSKVTTWILPAGVRSFMNGSSHLKSSSSRATGTLIQEEHQGPRQMLRTISVLVVAMAMAWVILAPYGDMVGLPFGMESVGKEAIKIENLIEKQKNGTALGLEDLVEKLAEKSTTVRDEDNSIAAPEDTSHEVERTDDDSGMDRVEIAEESDEIKEDTNESEEAPEKSEVLEEPQPSHEELDVDAPPASEEDTGRETEPMQEYTETEELPASAQSMQSVAQTVIDQLEQGYADENADEPVVEESDGAGEDHIEAMDEKMVEESFADDNLVEDAEAIEEIVNESDGAGEDHIEAMQENAAEESFVDAKLVEDTEAIEEIESEMEKREEAAAEAAASIREDIDEGNSDNELEREADLLLEEELTDETEKESPSVPQGVALEEEEEIEIEEDLSDTDGSDSVVEDEVSNVDATPGEVGTVEETSERGPASVEEGEELTHESEEGAEDATLEDPTQENSEAVGDKDTDRLSRSETDSDASDGLGFMKRRWQNLRKSPRVHGIVGGIQGAGKAIKDSPPVNGIISGIQDARRSVQKLLAKAIRAKEDVDEVSEAEVENEVLDFPEETSPSLGDSPSVDEIMHGIESALDRGHELMTKIKADAKSAGLDFE